MVNKTDVAQICEAELAVTLPFPCWLIPAAQMLLSITGGLLLSL